MTEIGPGDDGEFIPAAPVYVTISIENNIKPRFIEWDGCLCMPQQLRELTALKFKHLRWRPVLAFHQHFKDALPESGRVAHARILDNNCPLPSA